MSFDITDIISGVNTRTEQSNLLRELELLQNSLYVTGDGDFDHLLHHGVNIELSEAIQIQLRNMEKGTAQDVRKALLEMITNSVKNLKVIKMEIPVTPSEEMVRKIHRWIIDKTNAENIIDWAVDENIIGGARITFEGKYMDCTLNQAWEDSWQEIRQEI